MDTGEDFLNPFYTSWLVSLKAWTVIYHASVQLEHRISLLRDRKDLHKRVDQSMPPAQSVQSFTSNYLS